MGKYVGMFVFGVVLLLAAFVVGVIVGSGLTGGESAPADDGDGVPGVVQTAMAVPGGDGRA